MADALAPSDPQADHGLSSAEVAERVRRGLVNRPSRSHAAEYRAIFARNLFTLFNALVVPAAIALFLLHDYRGAVAVSGLAVVNTVMGLAQELRAKRYLDRLTILAEPKAHVIRDGRAQVIPSGEVVQDDHLVLQAGEAVLADGVVLTANNLEIDEALLTGESDPVLAPPGRPLLSGSYCVAGDGVYRADRVGDAAYAHQTGLEARRYRFLASPLQRIINRIIEILTVTAIALCLLYVVLYFARGLTTKELVQMVAATVTSMVPQGLVLFTTLAFILGAVRMSRRGAIVQRLSAVEAMAAIDVLCLDKTGTLTTNRLCLEQLRIPNGGSDEDEVRGQLALFGQSSQDERSKTTQAIRNALLPQYRNSEAFTISDRLPFKSQIRCSAIHFRGDKGEEFTLVLGAVEELEGMLEAPPPWPSPTRGEGEGGRPSSTMGVGESNLDRFWQELLATGMRVLLFARADGPIPRFEGRLPELRLRPLAIVGFRDELRPDAGEVLAGLAAQGIRFKIISGDHPDTICAIADRVGLPAEKHEVVTGADIAKAKYLGAVVDNKIIFARIAPRQKVEIVQALQDRGHRVAMTGDGINDILAVKRADLGIAMGSGSAATKTVAGIVLNNDRFELLPATLQEGRNILRNIRRAAKIFLLKNVYTLILILAALAVFRLPFPYLPQQVTLLNSLTIGIPVLILTLNRQPSSRSTHVGFLASVGWFALSTGALMGIAALAVFVHSAVGLGDPERMQRTMLLATLVLLGLGNLPRVLTGDGEPMSVDDWRFLLWIPAAAVLFLFTMYWPPAADFFMLDPLGPMRWTIVMAASALSLVAMLAMDYFKSEVWSRWSRH